MVRRDGIICRIKKKRELKEELLRRKLRLITRDEEEAKQGITSSS